MERLGKPRFGDEDLSKCRARDVGAYDYNCAKRSFAGFKERKQEGEGEGEVKVKMKVSGEDAEVEAKSVTSGLTARSIAGAGEGKSREGLTWVGEGSAAMFGVVGRALRSHGAPTLRRSIRRRRRRRDEDED